MEWAEGDGRKRRGRGRTAAKPEAKPRRSEPRAAAPMAAAEAPGCGEGGTRATPGPQPRTAARAACRTPWPEAARDPRPVEERRPREPALREPVMATNATASGRRGAKAAAATTTSGPSVQGFGDDVPAFMLIRSPIRAAQPRQTEENPA